MRTRPATKTGKMRQIAAVALSAILVFGLTPGPAFANLSSSGAPDNLASYQPAESKKESAVTVYVMASETSVVKGMDINETTTYTVNEKGLLVSRTATTKQPQLTASVTTDWTYNKNNDAKNVVTSALSSSAKKTLSYTKAGALKADKQELPYSGFRGMSAYKTSYKTKKGKVTLAKRTTDTFGTKTTTTSKFKYKNGRVASIVNTSGTFTGTQEYSYNKKGDLVKTLTFKGAANIPITHKLTYKNGRVVKRVSTVQSDSGTSTVSKFKYKAVKVPKSLVKKVKAQQWALVNGDLNFALGTW